MRIETFKNFPDFELLDTGNGYRLERWGSVILARPDPQIIWQHSLPDSEWDKVCAVYKSASEEGKGQWNINKPTPNPWIVNFKHPLLASPIPPSLKLRRTSKGEEEDGVKFLLKLSPFKHTGLFAEQAAQWEWMLDRIKNYESGIRNKKPKILNLFAYTGGATMVLAKTGCHVTHVDASKPAITWANENHELNNLPKDSVRWILDDCLKFAQRELKRGAKYQGIIMDPPAFGHSPTGKTWKFNQDLPELLETCVALLADDAKFLIINGYATNSSALAINNLLEDKIKTRKGGIEFGELCLKQANGRIISTGIFSRWSNS